MLGKRVFDIDIAQGHQKISNGAPPAQAPSHASDFDANLKNELLKAPDGKLGKGLDTGTAQKKLQFKDGSHGKRNGTKKRGR